MTSSDDNLPSRAKSGDGQGLAALLEGHTAGVRKTLAGKIPRRWRSVLSVDDVLQQTYIDAFLNFSRFDPNGDASFSTWLSSLAKYNLVDAVRILEADKRGRNHRRVQPAAPDDCYAGLYGLLSAAGTTPSQCVARDEARVDLEQAIQQLPEAYQRVVRMYDIEGRSAKEIARIIDRSPGAVHMIRVRAHLRLSEILGRPSKYYGTR